MGQNVRKLLLTVCVVASIFITRAQQPTTPLEFNNALTDVTDAVAQAVNEWAIAYDNANKTNNFDQLKPNRLKIVKLIDDKLKHVASMKDIKNSKPLRESIIEFLKFEKKLIAEGIVPFESLTASSTRAEKIKLEKQLTAQMSQQNDLLTKIGEAQKTYASENGFTLE